MVIQTMACKRSLDKEARSAAKDFCYCIQKNIFLYKKSNELYAHCYGNLEEKYKLVSIYFKMPGDHNYSQTLSKSTIDDVNRFMNLFLKLSDSCHSLPARSEHRY